MSYIYVDNINFEFEETPNYADILQNSGQGTQSLTENIITVAYIYVDQINFEIPVAEVPTDVLTNTGLGTQTLEEVIEGTPVPEPEVVVGGGAGQRIRVMGGRPWSEEDIYVTNQATQLIGEEILIGELVEAYAYNTPAIDTKLRRPIYARPRTIEILSFSPDTKRTFVQKKVDQIVEEPQKINSRQKEEEELLLLGII
jgi:hypothetical protein